MPEPLIATLIGVTLASWISALLWAARQSPRLRSRETEERGVYCVWCLYRRGDTCSHPGSPVYLEDCGPVCLGPARCGVRLERWRR